MRKNLDLLATMRLSALLTRRTRTKPVPQTVSVPDESDTALQTAFKTALRELGEVSDQDELIPWLENTGLERLHDEEKIAFMLEEIAQRSVGQSCQSAIKLALNIIAQDRNPENAQLDLLAHFPAAIRDAAAYSLDVLGYAPPDLSVFVPIPSAQQGIMVQLPQIFRTG